jgi:hypothetical protein
MIHFSKLLFIAYRKLCGAIAIAESYRLADHVTTE